MSSCIHFLSSGSQVDRIQLELIRPMDSISSYIAGTPKVTSVQLYKYLHVSEKTPKEKCILKPKFVSSAS